jgi:hypothetical protein
MTNNIQDREVPEDKSRKQVLLYEPVRDYLRQRSQVNGMTYSQQISQWLPEDTPEDTFEFADEEIVNIKPTPEIHEAVTGMAGKRVSPGDVITFYGLLAAIENGDLDAAAGFVEKIPDELAQAYLQASMAVGVDDDG